MAIKKSPMQKMKAEFGEKEKLVDRVMSVVALAEGEDQAAARTKLLAASNKKLLRLLEVSTAVQGLGGVEGMAQAVAKSSGKSKDASYVTKLTAIARATPARVLDMVRAADKRAKAASKS